MAAKSQRPKRRDDDLSSLNGAIGDLNLVEVSSIAPIKAVFGSASILLTEIRVGSPQSTVVDRWLMYAGLDDQRSGLRRTRTNLRWRLQSPCTGDGRETSGSAQSDYSQGD